MRAPPAARSMRECFRCTRRLASGGWRCVLFAPAVRHPTTLHRQTQQALEKHTDCCVLASAVPFPSLTRYLVCPGLQADGGEAFQAGPDRRGAAVPLRTPFLPSAPSLPRLSLSCDSFLAKAERKRERAC